MEQFFSALDELRTLSRPGEDLDDPSLDECALWAEVEFRARTARHAVWSPASHQPEIDQ